MNSLIEKILTIDNQLWESRLKKSFGNSKVIIKTDSKKNIIRYNSQKDIIIQDISAIVDKTEYRKKNLYFKYKKSNYQTKNCRLENRNPQLQNNWKPRNSKLSRSEKNPESIQANIAIVKNKKSWKIASNTISDWIKVNNCSDNINKY